MKQCFQHTAADRKRLIGCGIAVFTLAARINVTGFHALMYGYASLQQTAQTAADGGFHGFSRNVRDGVSRLDQIADLTARLEQAVCRGAQNALCRVAAYHTGNARIRQRRTRIQHPSECMPAHGLNRRVTVHAGRKARTDRNDDRRIRDVRTEVFLRQNRVHQGIRVQFLHAACRRIGQHSNDALFGQCCRFGCAIGSVCMHALNDCFAQSNRFRKAYRAADRRWLRQICQHQTNACAVQPQGNPRGNVSRTAYHD